MSERPPRRPNVSAGLLLFRRSVQGVELFLAHPGGPFWSRRDAGAWTIPKGVPNTDEPLEECARREFEEETGIVPGTELIPLGSVKQKAGKIVHAWAWEGDADPAVVRSNMMKTEWPRGSGRWLAFPEIDRCEWFPVDAAREKMNVAQVQFVDRLVALLERAR